MTTIIDFSVPKAALDAEGGTLKQNRDGPGHPRGHMSLA